MFSWQGNRGGSVLLILSVLLCWDVTHAGGCSKELRDECMGSIPLPMSLKSYAELRAFAVQVPELEQPAQALFGIPPAYLINRTCAIYHGLRGCALMMERKCTFQHVLQYQDFRTAFNDLCSMIGRIKYRNNYQCLTNSTKLDKAVVSCLEKYKISVEKANKNLTSSQNMMSLCRAGQQLKVCTLGAVSDICGQYSREFFFQFSFPQDQNLEAEHYCNEEVRKAVVDAKYQSSMNRSSWFICDDGSNIIPTDYKCDEDADCFNGQDEQGCDYSWVPKRLSTPAIVWIIDAICFVFVFVIIVCAFKIIQDRYSGCTSSPQEALPV